MVKLNSLENTTLDHSFQFQRISCLHYRKLPYEGVLVVTSFRASKLILFNRRVIVLADMQVLVALALVALVAFCRMLSDLE